jgi:hypothetical protein
MPNFNLFRQRSARSAREVTPQKIIYTLTTTPTYTRITCSNDSNVVSFHIPAALTTQALSLSLLSTGTTTIKRNPTTGFNISGSKDLSLAIIQVRGVHNSNVVFGVPIDGISGLRVRRGDGRCCDWKDGSQVIRV